MDSISDPTVKQVTLMWASQLGKTEIIHNTIGYFTHQDPTGILVVRPNLDDAKAWSKERLAPMFRDSPALHGLIREARARDSGNTILVKQFRGGWLAIVGSNSPAGLASRPARVTLFDEVDRFEMSAGTEGDPVALARQRSVNFWNRLSLMVSTPGLAGLSRIHDEFRRGDQRHLYVPCPLCGHMQRLQFWKPEGREGERLGHLRWDEGEPTTAGYCCAKCGETIEERKKGQMLAAAEWRPHNPDGDHPSFALNSLYSPWMTWAEVVMRWYQAQGNPELLKTFVNTLLGEPFEERTGAQHTLGGILSRREAYATPVPAGVLVLTAGVDVQDDRLECVVVGWGIQGESWRITREVLQGDPEREEVWQRLEEVRLRDWLGPDGEVFHILAMAVDSGFLTSEVYAYTKARYHQRVFATKGSSEPAAPLVAARAARNNRMRAPVFSIGPNAGKDTIYARLKVREPGPGFMHFPAWVDEDYAKQMTAEKVVRRVHRGRIVRVYELIRGERNEVLDCEVMALVALAITRWRPPTQIVVPKGEAAQEPAQEPQPVAHTQQQIAARAPTFRPPGGFIGRW